MSADTQIIQDGLRPRPLRPQRLAKGLRLSDVATVEHSVRARVGYGGGDVRVAGGSVYYSAAKGHLYCQALTDGSAFASGWVAPPDV
jgi:hypothetical protein